MANSDPAELSATLRIHFQKGLVIPATPLALDSSRKWDERRQRALLRYYLAAGSGGLAIGVHTTQFAIRDPKIGLYEPLLTLAIEEFEKSSRESIRIAGVCGKTPQAAQEAALAKDRSYHAALLSLGAMRDTSEEELLAHCRTISAIIPLVGFYLQPSVGGRVLPYSFWRQFAEIPNVIGIKIAPFNRYQTLDVVRAVLESGRTDIALYTGNDDNIVVDLLTPLTFKSGATVLERRIVGGLLGHWAVWTHRAVELHQQLRAIAANNAPVNMEFLKIATHVTDCNAAFFDPAHGFAGCIPGIHEVLRRQGLLEGIWCLDPNETLSPGQAEEIDRVYRAYPELNDDEFVEKHRDEWLRG